MIPIVIVVREECQIFRYHSFFLNQRVYQWFSIIVVYDRFNPNNNRTKCVAFPLFPGNLIIELSPLMV